jgi:thiamine biosynthesis lipoprotein
MAAITGRASPASAGRRGGAMILKNIPLVLLFPLLTGLFSCSRPDPAQAELLMGTVCGVNLYAGGVRDVYGAIFARLREIDRAMNANETEGSGESELGRINRGAGIRPVKVSGDLIAVLDRALYYAELSGGAFDPTVGPLVKLWDIGSETPRVPGAGEIKAACSLINWRDVLINREEGTVFLRKPGMALDLGAIAKGYAADEAAGLIKQAGLRRGIIDLGGNIFALGDRQGGRPWRIGVQAPDQDRGGYLGVLLVRDKSVVTSGVYERFFESGGRRYHHILSTRDGYPVENGLLSVTIVADLSIDADGLSTTVFALGYEKGRALIESVPGAEAVFVFADKSVRATAGMREFFSLDSGSYRIEE